MQHQQNVSECMCHIACGRQYVSYSTCQTACVTQYVSYSMCQTVCVTQYESNSIMCQTTLLKSVNSKTRAIGYRARSD